MEMCEDMVVDLNVVNFRKRQCMDTVIDHPLNVGYLISLYIFVFFFSFLYNLFNVGGWTTFNTGVTLLLNLPFIQIT